MQHTLIAVEEDITPAYLAELHMRVIAHRSRLKAARGRRVNRYWDQAGLLSEEGKQAVLARYRAGSRDWGF